MEPDRLDELARIAKKAAQRAKDDSLSQEEKDQALLEKQIALSELISELMEQIKVHLPKTQKTLYIYEEALQETWIYVCKNIDKYNPDRGPIMAWVIFILNRRKIAVFHWLTWQGNVIPIYQDEYDSEQNFLDRYQPPDAKPRPGEEVIKFLKEDPEGLFSKMKFKNNPKASFQIIALKRCESEQKWQNIVQELELGNTHGPVSAFYRRCCENQEIISYFKKYLCE